LRTNGRLSGSGPWMEVSPKAGRGRRLGSVGSWSHDCLRSRNAARQPQCGRALPSAESSNPWFSGRDSGKLESEGSKDYTRGVAAAESTTKAAMLMERRVKYWFLKTVGD
jgi:hypothetical protein